MDTTKMPFIPEDVLKIQRVEIYLNDLKDRINELRIQHDEVIHSSEEMMKEIDEVSSTLLATPNNSSTTGENMTKIKKLILEFESANETFKKQTPVALENHIDVQKILQNFEKLNESHFLKDSLTFLRKAKESLEKIDTYLGAGLSDLKKINIQDKIDMFNPNRAKDMNIDVNGISLPKKIPYFTCNVNNLSNTEQGFKKQNNEEFVILNETNDNSPKDKLETNSNYASCCSSLASLSVCKNSLNGYEGDNDDSEFDLNLAKKKRSSKFI